MKWERICEKEGGNIRMSSFGIPLSSVWIISKVDPGIEPHRSNVTSTNGVSGSSGGRCYHLELKLEGSLPRGKGITGMA